MSEKTGHMFINNFPPGALINLGLIYTNKLINILQVFFFTI